MKLCLLLVLGCFLYGCAGAGPNEDKNAALTPYNAACLQNMWLGRDFTAQGRFELAREHYLLALAASQDPETRNVITRELNSVDMMIKTRR